jgi:nucleoid DNA-binding protein
LQDLKFEGKKMKPIEIVERVRQDKPAVLGNMPDKKVAGIVRQALIQLGKQINALEEGVVTIPGFGSFRVRQVEKEKEGQKLTVRKIIFRPAQSRSGSETAVKAAAQVSAATKPKQARGKQKAS